MIRQWLHELLISVYSRFLLWQLTVLWQIAVSIAVWMKMYYGLPVLANQLPKHFAITLA